MKLIRQFFFLFRPHVILFPFPPHFSLSISTTIYPYKPCISHIRFSGFSVREEIAIHTIINSLVIVSLVDRSLVSKTHSLPPRSCLFVSAPTVVIVTAWVLCVGGTHVSLCVTLHAHVYGSVYLKLMLTWKVDTRVVWMFLLSSFLAVLQRDRLCLWTRACVWHFLILLQILLLNPIIGTLWFPEPFHSTYRLTVNNKEINLLLLRMIWFFSFSLFS